MSFLVFSGLLCAFLVAKTLSPSRPISLETIAVCIGTLAIILIFCLLVKWQPWHARMHITFFFLSAVSVSILIDAFGWRQYVWTLISALLWFVAPNFVLHNDLRPMQIWQFTQDRNARVRELFMEEGSALWTSTKAAIQDIKRSHIKRVGLMILTEDRGAYPFYEDD